MSMTLFGATSLTTHADLRRKPVLNIGQLTRTFVLFLCGAAALALVAARHPPMTDGDPAATALARAEIR